MLVCVHVAHAENYTVRGPERFNKLIGEHDLAVVLFYNQGTENIKDTFVDVGDELRYDKADVAFIHANVGRYKDLTSVVRDHGSGVPSVMLFRDGQRVKIPMLTGAITAGALRNYIDKSFGDRIDAIRKEQKEEREEDYDRRPRSGISFGVGVGYPYGYGYPYWGRPYWGGGYWGGRRYYRGGYWRGGRRYGRRR